ncbi:SDR family oxidoreductase [Vibrio rhizosphaerae]|uniref:SDR family oxidoreductase n=1 Tax=Vibrio rhizosphaerae TaxID=398736 RepID=UPI00056FBCA5|nr:SDR family oxidoreductase [Vibrio rhizosphaerae]
MKTALISGANQGIGFETARHLAKLGYFVYLGCRKEEAAKEAVTQLHNETLTNVDWVLLDVTSQAIIDAASESLSTKMDSLDVLINNAGILGKHNEDRSISVEETVRVFDTNVFGVMRVTQAFLPLLHKSDTPRIVNVSSGIGSLTCQSDPEWPFYPYKSDAYFPSKSALNAYTVAMAAKLGDRGFKVNSVDPGFIGTAFNNYAGPGKPENAAEIIVHAATLESDGPNGQFLSESEGSINGIMPW